MIRIGVLASEQIKSKYDVGSSRIRAQWLVDNWSAAEYFRIGQRYDAIIFQKAYWLAYAACYSGVKILDLCDPDFLHWRSKCIPMARLCDAVTTPTSKLADALRRQVDKPIVVIPDRLDLRHFTTEARPKKRIRGRTAAWFGYSNNYASLDACVLDLVAAGITRLVVISDAPALYSLPQPLCGALALDRYLWNFDILAHYLADVDIIVNYGLQHGRWIYKSNNKTLFGWAHGFPVAHDRCELGRLLCEAAAREEVVCRQRELQDQYDVKLSVIQYTNLIDSILAVRPSHGSMSKLSPHSEPYQENEPQM
jgi:hypothetical protein